VFKQKFRDFKAGWVVNCELGVIHTGERTAKVVTKVVLFWIECIDIDIPQPLTFTPVQFGKYSFNNKNYQR